MTFLALLVSLVVLGAKTADAGKCLQCTDMPHPFDCNIVTECTSMEECYVEQFITSSGITLYNSGCLSKQRCSQSHKRDLPFIAKRQDELLSKQDLVTCIECCQGEFCNIQGCYDMAPMRAKRGPKCFDCRNQESPEHCRDTLNCDYDQVCAILHEHPYDKEWSSKCMGKIQCTALVRMQSHQSHHLMGKRATVNVNVKDCPRCCEDDFCNDQCGHNVSYTVTTHAPPPTPKPTTHKPTTHKPTTHVHRTHPPTTHKQTTHRPTTHKPTVHRTHPPTTHKPTTHRPTTHRPTTHKPTTHKPTTHKPTNPPPTTTPHLVTTPDPKIACEADGYIFDKPTRMCLKFFTHLKLNWTNAQAECGKEGGRLVVITSHAKQHDVEHFLKNQHKYTGITFWVGATEISHVHTFTWTDGKTVVVDDSNKFDLTKTNCLLTADPKPAITYAPCPNEMAYICENSNYIRA